MLNTIARLGFMRWVCILAVTGLTAGLGSLAPAATYYVAQQDPKAADTNPGTETQPWTTLGHAANAIKSGDLVWVKLGTYHETLTLQCDQARFRVFRDDVVIIAPSETAIEPSVWHRVAGRTNVFEGKVDTKGKLLRVDGLVLEFELIHGVKTAMNPNDGSLKETSVERQFEDTDVYRWTRTGDGSVRVNLAGEDPAQHQLTLRSVGFVGIQMTNNARDSTVQGFEVRDAEHGIAFGGTGNRVEDCVVRGADIGALFGGAQNVLLRCALVRCWQGLYIADHVGNHVVEETFVLGSGHPVLRNRSPQTDLDNPWGPRCSVRYGNTSFNVCRYSVIAEGSWAGWWADVNCYGNYFYGNLVTRINDRGIYNEYPANDSRILYNAVTDCQNGIISRFCWRTHWLYNYLAGNRVNALGIWGPHLDVPYQFDNVIAKNLVTGSQFYWSLQDHQGRAPSLPIGWRGMGKVSPSAEFRLRSNLSANNLFKGKPGTAFGEINGVNFSTLSAFREATGMEQGSRMDEHAAMEELGLGLYTVRIPETARHDQPAVLVGNPIRQGVHVDPLPMAAEDGPYFWKQGDAAIPRGDEPPLSAFNYTYEWPDFGHPVRRLIRYDPAADPGVKLAAGADPQTWLECFPNEDPKVRAQMPAEGSGFWSPSLPTVPGAKIQVSFRLRGKKLKGFQGEPGPVACVKFQSLTGQHVSRQPLLGKCADGRVLGGEVEGDFPWREVRGEVQAPESAKRFSVFLGLKPAEGTVYFADIHIDTVAEPTPAAPAEPAEQYKPLSLAAYGNHDLDKDTGAPRGAPLPGTFERENCDLPVINLSRKKAGTYHAGRIPFRVDRAVSLRCFRRPPASLPAAVNGIAVGEAARSLYFLMAEPLQMGEQEFWRYIVHYADGQSVEVVPVKNATGLFYLEPYFLPHGGKPQGALALAAWVNDLGRVLRWVNPRPEVVIHSVDFRSMDTGQAVLLGLTLGTD